MQAVFPSVYILDLPDQGSTLGNSLVVGTREPTTVADFAANLPAYGEGLLGQVAGAAPAPRPAAPPPGTPVFTDDRAPVEQVVHELVFRYMLGSN